MLSQAKQNRGVFAAAIMACLLGSVTVHAQSDTVIFGKVTDAQTGEPIAGAQVTVFEPVTIVDPGGSWSTFLIERYRVAADGRGNYAVNVVPDFYSLRTTWAPGYRARNQGVDALEGTTTEANFALPRAAAPRYAFLNCIRYSTRGGKGGNRDLKIRLKIKNDFDEPVAHATATIDLWRNGVLHSTHTFRDTNGKGHATLVLRKAQRGLYEITLNDIEVEGLNYLGAPAPENSFDKGSDVGPIQFCEIPSVL